MGSYLHSRKWALGYGALLAVLLLLPYAAAWQAQGEAWRFSGFLLGVEDGNSYIAKMLTGTAGAWLFHPPYTTQNVPPLPLFGFYILAGKLAAPPALHLQLAVGYHLLRALGVVALALATYDFAALFLPAERWRRWAVVLATAGAGLGWLLAPWAHLSWAGPLCFYSPETYGFLGALLLAHWTWARSALLWVLVLILGNGRHPARRRWGALGLIFLLPLVQPLELAVLTAVLGVWGAVPLGVMAIRRRPKAMCDFWRFWRRRAALPFAAASVLALGYALLARFHPYLRLWSAQSPLPSPPLWQYGLAYGWLILLALPAWRGWQSAGWRKALPWLWAALAPLLVYLPLLSAQRRLVDGVWAALAVLAAAGIAALPRRWAWRREALAYGVLALALAPNFFIWGNAFRIALKPARPAFLPAAEVAAFRKLAAEASVGDGVLAAFPTANALPAWAPVRVIDGLGTESPHFHEAMREVKKFYSASASDGWRRAFLERNHLRWVFWGDTERTLGDWDPHEADFLCLRYEKGGYSFWQVCVDKP